MDWKSIAEFEPEKYMGEYLLFCLVDSAGDSYAEVGYVGQGWGVNTVSLRNGEFLLHGDWRANAPFTHFAEIELPTDA